MSEGKEALRARMREVLSAMTAAERARAGRDISHLVWTIREIAAARVLLLYASLAEEVPTVAIAAEARRRGIVVTYPRCLPETRDMALHRVSSHDELRAASYGILEPDVSCPRVTANEVDAALVPGMAWDRSGRRLGRGAGYYDRLFAEPTWRGFRCGLFFARQEIGELPADSWDAPLHAVVTEDGVTRIAPGTG